MQKALLIAYTPTGNIAYETESYEQTFIFKRICNQRNIPFSVHYTKGSEKQAAKRGYISKIRSLFSTKLF